MKFEKRLLATAVSEWRPYYLRYHKLKREIDAIKHAEHGPPGSGDEEPRRAFVQTLEEDVITANSFYEAQAHALAASVRRALEAGDTRRLLGAYATLLRLQQYRDLERCGVRKIAKKLDRCSPASAPRLALLWEHRLRAEPFSSSPAADALAEALEAVLSPESVALARLHAEQPAASAASAAGTAAQTRPAALLACAAAALFVALAPLVPGGARRAEQRCLALVVLAVLLWVSRAVPFFAAALLVPALGAALGATADATPVEAAARLVAAFWDEVVCAILAAFCVAACLGHARVEAWAVALLARALAGRPRAFLLALSAASALLCALVANVTAPIVVMSAVAPLVRDLGADCALSRALVLSVAVGCNLGGSLTPFASPHAAIATAAMRHAGAGGVAFAAWLACCAPAALAGVVAGWLVVIAVEPVADARVPAVRVAPHKPQQRPTPLLSAARVAFALAVAACWAAQPLVSRAVGGPGAVSMLAAGVAFGSGLLGPSDLASFSWPLLLFVGGASALSAAAASSGLLEWVVSLAPTALLGNWASAAALVFAMSSLVSHTVCAAVLMPVVAVSAGSGAVLASVAACSAAMALPSASLPNTCALAAEDDIGRKVLTPLQLVAVAAPASLLSAVVSTAITHAMYSLLF
eukprot:m51a1_g4394 hypothetical protein (643) ;mRNA; f:365097-367025